MKIIDCTNQKEAGIRTGSLRRSLSQLNLPFTREQVRARDLVIKASENVPNDHFFLICDLYLEELGDSIPFILVGPTGIWIINVSYIKGLYRANQDKWEVMDEKNNRYQAAVPNLLLGTDAMGDALEVALEEWQLEYTLVEKLLFFSNPGFHVDRSNPLVRIVLVDALERFFAGLPHKKTVMDKEQVERIADILSGKIFEDSNVEIQDDFSLKELPGERKRLRKPVIPSEFANVGRGEPAFVEEASRRFPFTRRQWILLALLLVFNIVVLSTLVVILLLFT